jgi:hypothetical protein
MVRCLTSLEGFEGIDTEEDSDIGLLHCQIFTAEVRTRSDAFGSLCLRKGFGGAWEG